MHRPLNPKPQSPNSTCLYGSPTNLRLRREPSPKNTAEMKPDPEAKPSTPAGTTEGPILSNCALTASASGQVTREVTLNPTLPAAFGSECHESCVWPPIKPCLGPWYAFWASLATPGQQNTSNPPTKPSTISLYDSRNILMALGKPPTSSMSLRSCVTRDP